MEEDWLYQDGQEDDWSSSTSLQMMPSGQVMLLVAPPLSPSPVRNTSERYLRNI